LGLYIPENYEAPNRHHAKKNLLCLRYLLIKKFFMSDMCLAGKNKKGEKSSNFLLNFLDYLIFVRAGRNKEIKNNFH
jgi:hypothetical protein